ncbi:SpaA isopeptide-forming pilin-related protein, partial [Gemella cuniculi]|uniref:SpaA isopeptide-forming pilin-related protein n=1 Tax=Gemella cuniculi TaxID=150240 RepID=UPI0005568B6E
MNIKMRKFMYICLAFVVVFCTSLTGKNTKSYAVENDYDSRYVGWTKATEANYDEAIYVSKENTDLTDVANAVVAYCFNFTYATPPYVDKGEEEAGKTKPTYIKNKATTQLFEELATSKRVSGDELVKAITKVVYNGYPHNAGGIKGSLSDGRFRAVTQYAVWYFTDSRVQEGLSSEEKEVFEQLTGQKEGAIEVPENVTLDIYKNTMEVKASTATNAAKPEYQHLLAATLVDKNTGKEITVTPQKTFDVHAKKEWANLPVTGGKTDVELTLYKDNQKVQFSDGQDNPKKVLSTDTQGEVSWKNLKGELSDYTIKEENVPANFEASAVTGSGTKEDPYTITNTYKNQSTTSITVTKQWSGEGVPEVKPDVYFELFKFGQPEAGTRKQLTDGKVVWDNIAPEDIMFYSVSEVDKDGKPWKAENYKAGRVQKVSNTEYTVTNEYTAPEPVAPVTKEIQISKVNLGGEEIAGAEIKILKSGAEVASWTSEAGKTKELKLEAGEYTFHEEAAPQGYKVVTDIKFTVEEDGTVKVVEKSENDKAEATGNKLTVTDDYTETKVKFSKKALTENGKELAGAEIELQTENGKVIENWESDGTIKEFNLKPRNYKFIEKAAPQGYALATEISFTVNTDGTVVSNGVKVESEAPIVMVDAYAKQEIQISKVNLGGEEIAGAEIEIQKDGKVVESWTSEKDKTHVVNLEAGEYTFHEKVAPEGYEVVTDITFKVEENGQVTVTNVNGNEVKAEGNKLTVT